jgi:hypothetical protein
MFLMQGQILTDIGNAKESSKGNKIRSKTFIWCFNFILKMKCLVLQTNL